YSNNRKRGALDVLESRMVISAFQLELRELRYDTFKAIIDNLHVLDLHVEVATS
ncbi:hypothetical protein CEXT_263941, partial [Caerostris extrusa]